MSELYVGRFNGGTSSGAMLEAFGVPERLGIRWSIYDYGVARIEATVKASGGTDVYHRMNRHFGGRNEYVHRLGVFDSTVHKCISGQIVGIRPESTGHVTYITRGPGWLLPTSYGPLTVAASTDTTTDQLKNYLSQDTPRINGDLSDVDETNTPLGGWQPKQPYPALGTTVGEFIELAKEMSSSNGEVWDFWLVDEPMKWGDLREFKPYFKNRADRTVPDWFVSIRDFADLNLERGMYDYRSAATVYYGTYLGTATGGSSTSLVDTGATFLDGSLDVGDEVVNITDDSRARIREIVSNTTLNLSTLSGGSGNNFASSDAYSIQAGKRWNYQTSNDGIFDHLSRIIIEHRPEMNSTQASQYAAALENYYKTPVQSAAFVISAPYIRDAAGANRPLWSPIFDGGGIIQITDLYPAGVATINEATNNLDTFLITSLDYDSTTNQLRVGVNIQDGRLDARLAALKILGSPGISRKHQT